MEDGEPYPSGTAYEVLTAIGARQTKDLPDIFVFRKTERPQIALDDEAALERARSQWGRLQAFFQRWFVTTQGHFLAAFQSFRTTDDFEEQIEALLRDWLGKHAQVNRVVWPLETKGSPFRGLEPFDARHAPVFFGRSRDIAGAAERLKAASTSFLLIVGASGAGKSSLARAGLVPRITAPGFIAEVDLWRVALMRPGAAESPFHALAEALFAAGGSTDVLAPALPELADGDYKRPTQLAALLRMGDEAATRPVISALDRIAETEQRRGGFDRMPRADLLLVVD